MLKVLVDDLLFDVCYMCGIEHLIRWQIIEYRHRNVWYQYHPVFCTNMMQDVSLCQYML